MVPHNFWSSFDWKLSHGQSWIAFPELPSPLMIHYYMFHRIIISVPALSSFHWWVFFYFLVATAFFPLALNSKLNEQTERVNQEKPRCTAWLYLIHPLGNPSSCGINALANMRQVLFAWKSLFECQIGYLLEQNLEVGSPATQQRILLGK